jgi:hypothetical protein
MQSFSNLFKTFILYLGLPLKSMGALIAGLIVSGAAIINFHL